MDEILFTNTKYLYLLTLTKKHSPLRRVPTHLSQKPKWELKCTVQIIYSVYAYIVIRGDNLLVFWFVRARKMGVGWVGRH